jgi:hypothetical protein
MLRARAEGRRNRTEEAISATSRGNNFAHLLTSHKNTLLQAMLRGASEWLERSIKQKGVSKKPQGH